ncbi:hypothetical protein PZE06_05450 [Robertmurraya sp. DFI.2.37]|uniref:hypothetical protein n=1 Tax=Robertmurraya sp. DFI.2.37 TaxID=3031819 RepID=UPI00124931F3|nr:hypothetical protein [Robertmurraya sp. DFI.2.37]MDF1507626.1 hypothetical protein [Robertmurraya sp. DFI.2.37]
MENIANHSEDLLKLDLQFFSEDEVILPDDFEESPPQAEETQEQTLEVENSDQQEINPMEDIEEQSQEEITELEQPQTLKIKFNHEEQEIPIDEAVPLVQKGMNYDKLQERLNQIESDPRLSFVEELAKEQGMSPEEYIESYRQWQEQERLNQLVQQNIPEELAQEILESRKFRETQKQQEQQKKQEEKQKEEAQEFFEYFKQVNDRDYNPEKDQIPQEVWQMNAQGVPLKFAYMQHHNNQLLSQIKVLKQNKSNEEKAPIQGVTTHGTTSVEAEDDFLKGFNSI